MKIFLFGGARTKEDGHSDVEPLMKLIEKVIHELKPKQIFHVPFARTTISQIERADGRFAKHINLDGIEYLDANDEGALEKADSSVVFFELRQQDQQSSEGDQSQSRFGTGNQKCNIHYKRICGLKSFMKLPQDRKG